MAAIIPHIVAANTGSHMIFLWKQRDIGGGFDGKLTKKVVFMGWVRSKFLVLVVRMAD